MTVATTGALITLTGNGSTTVFDFNFIIPFESDGVTPACQVWYTAPQGIPTLLAVNTYLIAGVGAPNGGSITYNPGGVPIPVGSYLSIIRTVPYTQPDSVPNQAFYPNTVEIIADMIVEQIQQLQAQAGFALRVPLTDPLALPVLPSANLRANTILGFNASGSPVLYSSSFSTIVGTYIIAKITAGTYNVTNANIIFADASSGNITINLPHASVVAPIYIQRLDNTANTVAVTAQAGEGVNGAQEFYILSQNQSGIFLPDGGVFWGVF